MYNWSVDTKELVKNEEKYAIWRLGQLINFGLNKEKLKKEDLEKHLSKLDIDPFRRRFLERLLKNDNSDR